MATISSPEIIKDLLRKKGISKSKDDLDEIDWKLIYSYKNKNGELLFAVFNDNDAKYDDIYRSPFTYDQILLMENGWLTKGGAEFLGVNQSEFNIVVNKDDDDGCGGKYYRTVIQVEILSNDPYEFISLEDVAYDVMDGECSGNIKIISSEEIDPKIMAELLVAQGSNPCFLLQDKDLESLGLL